MSTRNILHHACCECVLNTTPWCPHLSDCFVHGFSLHWKKVFVGWLLRRIEACCTGACLLLIFKSRVLHHDAGESPSVTRTTSWTHIHMTSWCVFSFSHVSLLHGSSRSLKYCVVHAETYMHLTSHSSFNCKCCFVEYFVIVTDLINLLCTSLASSCFLYSCLSISVILAIKPTHERECNLHSIARNICSVCSHDKHSLGFAWCNSSRNSGP